MPRRNNGNQFELAVAKHDKLTDKSPIGRAALLRSLDTLDTTGNEAVKAGTITISQLAETMQDVLTPIDNANYTKPPLDEVKLANIAGKLAVFNAIAGARTPEAPAEKPTDTTKIATSKRKA